MPAKNPIVDALFREKIAKNQLTLFKRNQDKWERNYSSFGTLSSNIFTIAGFDLADISCSSETIDKYPCNTLADVKNIMRRTGKDMISDLVVTLTQEQYQKLTAFYSPAKGTSPSI